MSLNRNCNLTWKRNESMSESESITEANEKENGSWRHKPEKLPIGAFNGNGPKRGKILTSRQKRSRERDSRKRANLGRSAQM